MENQPPAPLRIGAVTYLNTRPLVEGLDGRDDVALGFDVPSALAEKLRLGEIDVGLIPIVEYLRGVGEALVPGVCIASDGPVRTVKLFSRVHPRELSHVAVDSGSRTSVALLRILLAERFGVTPDFHTFRADLRDMLQVHEAALLIGDPAFTDSGAPYVWDLGQGWQDLTGLPFVYAAWVVSAAAATEAWLPRVLADAARSGCTPESLARIATTAAGLKDQPAEALLSYLRDALHYDLGPRELRGIETFQQLCVRYNLVPSRRELCLVTPSAASPSAVGARGEGAPPSMA